MSQLRGGHAKEETIAVEVHGQDGTVVNFKILGDIKLSTLFKKYCEKKQMDYQTVRFIYEGNRLLGKSTANKMKMVNGAEIFCMSYQRGGGRF